MWLMAATAMAQDSDEEDNDGAATVLVPDDEPQDLIKRTLPLRTALHHDPSLGAPFERLIILYREAGRLPELIELYRQHTTNYPTDPNGAAVLVRLLATIADSQASATAQAMSDKHPTNGYLQYLLFQARQRGRQPGALDALERAVAAAGSSRQKTAWTEVLLTEAATSDRPQLVDKYLTEMAAAAATPADKLEVAQRMTKFNRHAAALALLELAAKGDPAPELAVRIEMAAASSEVAANKTPAAAARLERLLARLAPDYWGRPEIVRRRIALVTSEEERTAMVDAAYQRKAQRATDEAAVIDLAQLLIGFERRREALTVLLQSSGKLPASESLEKLTLELVDRLRDEPARQSYLEARIKAFPKRTDLLALQVKSLLMTGDRQQARQQLDKLVKLLPAAERIDQQLEMARSFRRSNLAADAAELLQRVVDGAPDRFDLRRELAELYLKLGNRGRARELFAGQLPAAVQVENVLDFVPFLIQQEMFAEARRTLVKAITPDEPNIEVRLLLADVERRTGNRTSADRVLTETRALTDTPARYRQWIEAAATLHQEDESLPAFVAAERQRLTEDAGDWNENRVERILSLLDVAGRDKSKIDLVELVAPWLDEPGLPPLAATKIRQQLVRAMDKASSQADVLATQLQQLIDTHPDDADEYRARLAMLHLRGNQYQLAQPMLAEVRVAQLTDVALLGELEKAFGQLNQPHRVLAVLERLTTLEPANKSNWEAWLYHLAMAGQEERLRDALRRLVAGVDGLKLEDPVRQLLQAQLIDSYGRSIISNLTDGRPGPLSDALTMLGAAERLTNTPRQALWLCWNRAYILNRLHRDEQRDEAIYEMERIYAEYSKTQPPAAKTTTPAPSADAAAADATAQAKTEQAEDSDFELDAGTLPRMNFPDGLTISMPSARRLLTEPPQPMIWPAADARSGPLPKLSQRAGPALDMPADRPIERVLATSPERVFVLDTQGTLYGVDARTGKVTWETAAALPPTVSTVNLAFNVQLNGYRTPDTSLVPPLSAPVLDAAERLFFGSDGQVTCISGKDGQVAWRSSITGRPEKAPAGKSRLPMPVFLYESAVLGFDPDHDAVGAFDAATGKLLWSIVIGDGQPLAEHRMLHWLNSGATLDGHRLFVYGRRTALVDLATREVEWLIEPERARKLPVRLDPPGARQPSGLGLNQVAGNPAGMYNPGVNYNQFAGGFIQQAQRRFIQQPQPVPTRNVDYQNLARNPVATGAATRQLAETRFLGPVAVWSTNSLNGQPRAASLKGSRLILAAPDRISVLDVALPLTGRNTYINGTYLGCVGHLACFLRANEFCVLDLSRGLRGTFSLSEATGGVGTARVQAVVDGPLVYISGPRAVICFNVLSGRRVFESAWPEGAVLDVQDSRVPGQALLVDQGCQYLWNGIAVPLNQGARCIASIGAVQQGRLYATVSPWRLVALEGAAEK